MRHRVLLHTDEAEKADLVLALLADLVETVPSGMGEIARRGAEGFSYIRP